MPCVHLSSNRPAFRLHPGLLMCALYSQRPQNLSEKELPALLSKMHSCSAVSLSPTSSSSKRWCALMIPRACLNLITYNAGIVISSLTVVLMKELHPRLLQWQCSSRPWHRDTPTLLPRFVTQVSHRCLQGTALKRPLRAGHSSRELPPLLGQRDLWASQSRGLLKHEKEHPC